MQDSCYRPSQFLFLSLIIFLNPAAAYYAVTIRANRPNWFKNPDYLANARDIPSLEPEKCYMTDRKVSDGDIEAFAIYNSIKNTAIPGVAIYDSPDCGRGISEEAYRYHDTPLAVIKFDAFDPYGINFVDLRELGIKWPSGSWRSIDPMKEHEDGGLLAGIEDQGENGVVVWEADPEDSTVPLGRLWVPNGLSKIPEPRDFLERLPADRRASVYLTDLIERFLRPHSNTITDLITPYLDQTLEGTWGDEELPTLKGPLYEPKEPEFNAQNEYNSQDGQIYDMSYQEALAKSDHQAQNTHDSNEVVFFDPGLNNLFQNFISAEGNNLDLQDFQDSVQDLGPKRGGDAMEIEMEAKEDENLINFQEYVEPAAEEQTGNRIEEEIRVNSDSPERFSERESNIFSWPRPNRILLQRPDAPVMQNAPLRTNVLIDLNPIGRQGIQYRLHQGDMMAPLHHWGSEANPPRPQPSFGGADMSARIQALNDPPQIRASFFGSTTTQRENNIIPPFIQNDVQDTTENSVSSTTVRQPRIEVEPLQSLSQGSAIEEPSNIENSPEL